jgi:hypothetical protein
MRAFACLVLLATTGLLVPATAAVAATKLTANITCDAETGAITTWASGTLLTPGTAPTSVTVEFQRRSGVRVTVATSTSVPPLAQPFTVRTTTTSAGDVTATGYTGSFSPATSLFYRETLLVTFKNASSGATYTTREATCDYDQRTTVALTCDPTVDTVTAAVAGINGNAGASSGAGRPTRVGYHIVQIVQSTPDSPRFRGESLGGGWDVQHRLSQAADGTWADIGYVRTVTSNPYYYAEEVTVGVSDAYGTVVGSGTAKCTLIDGSLTPAAHPA